MTPLELYPGRSTAGLEDDFNTLHANPDHLIFKNSHIYQYQVLRIHYTIYDVWHAEDILNPNTEHCDVMMLHHSESGKQDCTPPLVYITPSLRIHLIPRQPLSASRKRLNLICENQMLLGDFERGLLTNESGHC